MPFVRPVELSNDYVVTFKVIKHAIEWMESNNYTIENVCCLYATAPFVQPQIISRAFEKLKNSNLHYCFSLTSFPFPIQRAIKIDQNDKINMFNPGQFDKRSQDLETAFHDAGQFYWGKSQAFKDELPLFSEFAIPYILPSYLVQDIDTNEDWIRAEVMHKVLQESNMF